jgi:hypothetical protein
MHFRNDVLNAAGQPVPELLDLVGRCGGNSYVRASGEALFDVPKPLTAPGIGVDALPQEVQQSSVLTGNELAQLGSLLELPDETDVNDFKLLELSDLFMEFEDDGVALELAIHEHAQKLIAAGDVTSALKAVLTFNPG